MLNFPHLKWGVPVCPGGPRLQKTVPVQAAMRNQICCSSLFQKHDVNCLALSAGVAKHQTSHSSHHVQHGKSPHGIRPALQCIIGYTLRFFHTDAIPFCWSAHLLIVLVLLAEALHWSSQQLQLLTFGLLASRRGLVAAHNPQKSFNG